MKLSRKSAVRIASLFNSIHVAECMMDKARKATPFDSASYRLWQDDAIAREDDLIAEFGITVIGSNKRSAA